ncbi:RrF2 family transcriptional regulator [Algoriphagus persicinus]|uniref:RrF2 family transcriptional regulator n=1 Tax=Algoriphagus persicinus TaxID=3108754 RepID=UPI002B3DEFA9|nr:Rrf2 family transcriptional regulator [Algoriphagus sp. E1-3-M2]MEB2785847.1 Rrf2 family transcriptional regulator [Algoriphagus sp. E1-3-M2]
MFSKACEYGIKAIIYIASQSMLERRVKIGEVVSHIDSPVAFTAKIVGALVKENIVQSVTGPYGGFYIDRYRMDQIKMSDIVIAIDGDSVFNGCGLGLKECDAEQPCPMHSKFVKVRADLKGMLNSTSILELAEGLKSGKSILMR